MRMNSLILMTCLAVMASGIKACCLPDKFSMDFSAEIHKEDYEGKTARETEVYDVSGSLGADFENERFRLHYTDHKKKTSNTWFFDFAKGEYVYHHRVSTDKRSETCRIHPLTGQINKSYKCILGNKNLVKRTKKNYQLVLANVAKLYGHLDMNEENCQLFGKQVLAIILGADKYVQARIDVLEVKTFGIKLVAPCYEGRNNKYAISFPSVDELSAMRSETLTVLFDKITQFHSSTVVDVDENDGETSPPPETSGEDTDFSGHGPSEDDSSGHGHAVSEDDEDQYYDDTYYPHLYRDLYDDASADGEGQDW
ncbi:uncharacterized protein LOC135498496 [Lineus longissimus]|uniref:uncharacterized protein LOC135498496 n=1 Tax=Lineus longissimus TaxID=88925 RepID=UPI002B4F05DB